MSLDDIRALPVAEIAADPAHLTLWVPNALLPGGLPVMAAWGSLQCASSVLVSSAVAHA